MYVYAYDIYTCKYICICKYKYKYMSPLLLLLKISQSPAISRTARHSSSPWCLRPTQSISHLWVRDIFIWLNHQQTLPLEVGLNTPLSLTGHVFIDKGVVVKNYTLY